MLKYIRFLVLCFLAISTGSSNIFAQVLTTETDAELRIKKLEKQADSLRSAAGHLRDSLGIKKRHKDFGNLFLNADSLLGVLPPSIQDWTNEIPKNYHFEMPDIPEYKYFEGKTNPLVIPKKGKKRSTVPGFKGWYLQELAEKGE